MIWDTIIDKLSTPNNLLVDPNLNLDLNLDLALIQMPLLKQLKTWFQTLLVEVGCLALMGSVAFLAPGDYHDLNTGMSLGTDQGTPILELWVLSFSIVCSGLLCSGSLAMCMYLALNYYTLGWEWLFV